MKHRHSLALVALLALTLAACTRTDETATLNEGDTLIADTAMAVPVAAVANLQPTTGSNVSGTVTFTEEEGGIRIVANVTGLPEGEHGFHVHEFGDCGDDGNAAGGHYAPLGSQHGAPEATPGQRHVGDFGNLTADASGTATYDRLDQVIAFSGERSIVGKALIVHADPDDLTTQPSGNAGSRLACGIIEMQGSGMNAPDAMLPVDTTATDPASM